MTVNFKQTPTNLRVPLFYAEMDNSRANTGGGQNLRALLIGQKTAAGIATAATPIISQGVADAKTQFGLGSMLAMMVESYRNNDAFGELWCLPLSDAGGAVAATGSIAFSGTSTVAGVLSLYVAGTLLSIPLASGTTAAQAATAVAAAVTANTNLPVSCTAATSTATFLAKNLGAAGNDLDIRLNYRGTAGGESTPAGLIPTITAMTAGATNPVLTPALANLLDMPFEFICMPYTDATSIAAMTAFLNDTAGRWSWQTQIYGHYFMAYRGTFSGQTTFGLTLNDQHASAIPVYDSPTCPPCWAAAVTAQAAISVRADQAQPIRNVVLQGILAPPIASRFSLSQRNTLLFDGMSITDVDQAGNVILRKLITTYQLNSFGAADNSYLDAETMFNLAGILRRLQGVVTSKYARVKLAANGTFLTPGTNVVTPNMIRADIIAEYRAMEALGQVQQSTVFAQGLVVEQNASNPNRVDVLYPAILVNRLDVFALLAQFRLA